ncbi:MAG: aminodeoxychorismate synthase component I [Rikenellaceae bacterium]|nr:aminodeoxychorismate synthase component I [Rikenellaceae bacterium]MCL2692410.1 aminodeoxychorismate synthase component I [Rikenellaceae bacterium]
MYYTDLSLLRDRMNRLCADAQSFLFVINYERTEGYLVEDPPNRSEVFYKFPTVQNKPFPKSLDKKVQFAVRPNSVADYKRKFDKLHKHLTNGEIALANLTERTEIETNLSLEEIFALSESSYQIYIPDRFVCFSPERFVRIADGVISANPMKGTIDAATPDAEQIILNDPKEIAEHGATVTLLCDELRPIADNVRAVRFRYIDRLRTNRKDLLQVSSEIVGDLPPDYLQRMGDIIFSLLPAGSIAGTPKQRAAEILHDIEGRERGFYCGVAGYFDGRELDSAVLIRFIEQDSKGKSYFRSGGGVTADSICEREYDEVLNKIYLPFA